MSGKIKATFIRIGFNAAASPAKAQLLLTVANATQFTGVKDSGFT